MADGLNLHDGISHVTVSQTYVRNSGDDGLAMWSENHADHDNTFSANTVVLPMLANGIAVILVTTLWGLIIAIPSLVFWSYYNKKVETIAVEMETLCDEFVRRQYREEAVEKAL